MQPPPDPHGPTGIPLFDPVQDFAQQLVRVVDDFGVELERDLDAFRADVQRVGLAGVIRVRVAEAVGRMGDGLAALRASLQGTAARRV